MEVPTKVFSLLAHHVDMLLQISKKQLVLDNVIVTQRERYTKTHYMYFDLK